jgi:membrane protein implicated in regulation of membrane protease activity
MAAALIFLILEITSPTFIFFAFFLGALISGIFTYFQPEQYYWQMGIFTIVSVAILPFTRRLARRITSEAPPQSNVDRLLGQTAIVTQEIDPDQGGKVRIEGEIWVANADEPISAKEKVKIVSVAGTRLRVARLSSGKE